jgi:hypothetical protein
MYTALIEGSVVPPIGGEIPSTHRWGSSSKSFAEQLPGIMMHDLSNTLFKRVFASFKATDSLLEVFIPDNTYGGLVL